MTSWRIIVCLLALTFLVAGCGVRGSLDPPPGSEKKKDEPIVLDKII